MSRKRLFDLLRVMVSGMALCWAMLCGAQPLGVAITHSVTFINVQYDVPASGQSTWFYRVDSRGPPAISHVIFALNCQGLMILDAGTWDGVNPGARQSKAGNPEPNSFPSVPKRDPTTGLTGQKFDQGFNDQETRYYYFTLDKKYPTGDIQYAIKAAWYVLPGIVTGPTCGGIAPVSAIALEKTGTTISHAIRECNVFGPAGVFNALVIGDLTTSGGDTENRLGVGGTARFIGGYSVGIAHYGEPIPTNHGDAVDMLIVGGDLYDGIWGVNGNIVHGGTRYGPVRHMQNENIVRHVSPVTFDENGNVPDAGGGLSFAELHARMIARSIQLGALPDRGVVMKGAVSPHHACLIGDDPELNVFNVTQSGVVANSRIDIVAPSGATVLVNIKGTEMQYLQSAMALTGVEREFVLFNYVNATQMLVAGFTHEGSVLAPHASAILAGGAVEGQAVFGGNVSTHTGYEFHNYPFRGRICVDSDVIESHIVYKFKVSNNGEVALTNIVVSDPKAPVTGGPITLNPGETNDTAFSAVYLLTVADLAEGSFSNQASVTGQTPAGDVVSNTASDAQVFAVPGPYIHAEGVDHNSVGGKSGGKSVSVTIMIYSGIYTGFPADWWLLALPHSGDQWYFMNAAGQWTGVQAGDIGALQPTYQGPLVNVFAPLTILPGIVLPVGKYSLVFAVDQMDGILHYPEGPIMMDAVTVTISN